MAAPRLRLNREQGPRVTGHVVALDYPCLGVRMAYSGVQDRHVGVRPMTVIHRVLLLLGHVAPSGPLTGEPKGLCGGLDLWLQSSDNFNSRILRDTALVQRDKDPGIGPMTDSSAGWTQILSRAA
jgi:hypothetical protein